MDHFDENAWDIETLGMDDFMIQCNPSASCRECGIVMIAASSSALQVTGLDHIVREHPLEFLEITGEMPTKQLTDDMRHALLEGMLDLRETGLAQ